MTPLDALKRERDTAFARYLAVRKAGGKSKAKRQALVVATLEWLELARQERLVMNNIDCVLEYHNMHRLHIWHAGYDLYHWRVTVLETDEHFNARENWILTGSTFALPFEDALCQGRAELAMWSEG